MTICYWTYSAGSMFCIWKNLHVQCKSLTIRQNSGCNALHAAHMAHTWPLHSCASALLQGCSQWRSGLQQFLYRTWMKITPNQYAGLAQPMMSLCLRMRPGVAFTQILVKVDAISLSWSLGKHWGQKHWKQTWNKNRIESYRIMLSLVHAQRRQLS